MRFRASRLHEWRWPLLVLVLGLLVALAAAWMQHRQNQRHARERLDAAALRVADQLRRRLQSYEYGLIADRSAVLAAGGDDVELQRRSFERFAATLPLQRHFPGARGIGFIRRVPRAQAAAFVAAEQRAGQANFRIRNVTPALDRPAQPPLPDHWLVHFITPPRGNEGAQGLDIGSGERRRAALLAALRSGEARLSAPLTLPQALDAPERGLLLFLPVYAQPLPPPAPAAREAAIVGWAHMPLVIDEVLGDFDFERASLSMALSDATDPGTPPLRFFTAPGWDDAAAPRRLARQLAPELFGRRWLVQVQALPTFVQELHQPRPLLVAAGIAPLALLSALLLLSVARTYRARAGLEEQVRRRTRELEQLAARERAIVASAATAVIAMDLDGRITAFNPAAEAMFRRPAAGAVGYLVTELCDPGELRYKARFFPAEVRAHAQRLPDALRQGLRPQPALPDEGPRNEWTYRRQDGTTFPGLLSMSVLRDEDGRASGFLAVIADLSERKAMEQALRRHAAELEAVHAQLRERTRQAEAASAAKTSFLANMSHEIRTPLNAVIGLTQLLEQTALDERQRRFVHHVGIAGGQLLGLVNDILDLSKIEAGEMRLEDEAFELQSLLLQVRALTEGAALEKGLQWRLDAAPQLPRRVRGDAMRLRQVLVNLLSNAAKFTEDGGVTLRVSALSPSPPSQVRLCFEVEDSGIGIAPEKQVAIFQPFTQADASTTRRFGGTGLGLSIVQRLVALMGGRLALRSVPGRGSTFSVTLTLALAAD